MRDSLVFFGSGPVAKSSLEFIGQHFRVEAVITKPSTLEEMKQTVQGIPVFAAGNADELDDLITTQLFKSRLGVLVDFGVIVSKEVIDYFPLGIINSHFSLLPEWRGADPITFAVLSGQAKTGVSLMLLAEKMDTGKLIAQKALRIKPGTTTPGLTDELISLSNKLLLEYLPDYISGKIKPKAQPLKNGATYSRRLTKADGNIDWAKTAQQIERQIRAFLGWPGSRTTIAGKEVIILKASVAKIDSDKQPGQAFVHNKNLAIKCADHCLVISKLKPAGKNEMTGQAFIAGHKRQLSES